MKIVSGKLKFKNIFVLKKNILRPTSLKLRLAIINILIHRFDWKDWHRNASILEPYAGTGSVSMEAISRGLMNCSLIEKDKEIFMSLKKNIKNLNLEAQTFLYNQDFLSFQNLNKEYKIIFLDPPYKNKVLNLSIDKILDEKIAGKNTIIICESRKNHLFSNSILKKKVVSKDYGSLKLTFFLI